MSGKLTGIGWGIVLNNEKFRVIDESIRADMREKYDGFQNYPPNGIKVIFDSQGENRFGEAAFIFLGEVITEFSHDFDRKEFSLSLDEAQLEFLLKPFIRKLDELTNYRYKLSEEEIGFQSVTMYNESLQYHS